MRFLVIALCLMLSEFALAHSLQNAIALSAYANQSVVMIKFKDSVNSDAMKLNGLMAGKKSYAIEPMLTRGSAVYEKERTELARKSKRSFPHLENYYYMFLDQGANKQTDRTAILTDLYANEQIEFAIFEPKWELATLSKQPRHVRANPPAESEDTPDFEHLQNYLDPSPRGVDARYGWEQPGGTGAGIKVIDVETGWHEEHEDFNPRFYFSEVDGDKDHGTAVWGEIAAKRDGKGMTGIAYDVEFGTAGTTFGGGWDEWRVTVVRALDLAASQLSDQDVIIVEQHAPGPENGNFTAVEYWRPIFDVIEQATARGIHVIAAAGNGNSNFDDPLYEGAFDLDVRDSGSVLVGAGGNVQGSTHLRRLSFSNYGARVDCFGYGENVYTTGYGDLHGSSTENYYTADFGGTSSATPIVTGVVASLLGMAKANGTTISPREMRDWLRGTGVAQEGEATQRIGTLPDLRELHSQLLAR